MKVNLSIVLDKDLNIKEDLYEASSLKELDEYLLKFRDSKEVREKYKDIIQEFLLDNRSYLEKLTIKSNGRICITFSGKTNILRTVPAIYKDSDKLMNTRECIKKIQEELKYSNILKELYNKKGYLLSDYERDTIRLYFNSTNPKYKDEFIGYFSYRLLKTNDNLRYYYLRSLMNLCHLTTKSIKIKSGIIDNIDFEMPTRTSLVRNNIASFCEDDRFMQYLDNEDYEDLFNEYSIDDIVKNSIDEKNPLGIRK